MLGCCLVQEKASHRQLQVTCVCVCNVTCVCVQLQVPVPFVRASQVAITAFVDVDWVCTMNGKLMYPYISLVRYLAFLRLAEEGNGHGADTGIPNSNHPPTHTHFDYCVTQHCTNKRNKCTHKEHTHTLSIIASVGLTLANNGTLRLEARLCR